jgi:RNA polymerase sigma factor (sigma-70 family)
MSLKFLLAPWRMDKADAQDQADVRRSQTLAILARVAAGERAALRQLYDCTSAKLFGICVRICADEQGAEDVLQEVYIAVWNRAAGYDPERSSPITWLATIARNRAIDWRRSRHRADDMLPIDAASALADAAISAPDRVDDARAAVRLRACLDNLDARAEKAIREAYYDGFSYAELAARDAVPLGTMKSWIRRGLDRLRKCLTDGG